MDSMAVKVGRMAGNTLATSCLTGRTAFQCSIKQQIMTGSTAAGIMHLTCTCKRTVTGRSSMAAYAVTGIWRDGNIHINRAAMIVTVAVKVSGMTLRTGCATEYCSDQWSIQWIF